MLISAPVPSCKIDSVCFNTDFSVSHEVVMDLFTQVDESDPIGPWLGHNYNWSVQSLQN